MAGTVHVFGMPDGCAMAADERACDAPDRGEAVVFHLDARPHGDAWSCWACGLDTDARGQNHPTA